MFYMSHLMVCLLYSSLFTVSTRPPLSFQTLRSSYYRISLPQGPLPTQMCAICTTYPASLSVEYHAATNPLGRWLLAVHARYYTLQGLANFDKDFIQPLLC